MDKTPRLFSTSRAAPDAPLVSVIVPVYKGAHYLKTRSIPSILGQAYKNFECLIVDDGSPDNTEEVARGFAVLDKRIRYFKKDNGGPSSARNFGVRKSHGSFIAFLDQDDEYLPKFLETTVGILSQLPKEIGALTSGCVYIDDKGKRTYNLQLLEPFWQLAIGSGWTFRRSCFFDFNVWYDESIMNYEDVDITLHLRKHCRFHAIDKPLRLRYLYFGGGSKSHQSASQASPRLIPFFNRFFEKNFEIYNRAGKEALAWLYHSGGLMYCQVGRTREGRKMLWQSFICERNYIVFANFIAALFGARAYNFLFNVKNRLMRKIKSEFLNPVPREQINKNQSYV